MALRHRRTTSDASALSFAVIYDPELGLQSYVTESASPILKDDAETTPIPSSIDNAADAMECKVAVPLEVMPQLRALPAGRRRHFLDLRPSSLFERKYRGEEVANDGSPVQSDFSKSIYSQDSATDSESTRTYRMRRAPNSSHPSAPRPESISRLRPKLSFLKMPSFYGKVSLYRKKPPMPSTMQSDNPTTVLSPLSATVVEPPAECSSGPKLYTMLHRAHTAHCAGGLTSADATCCDMGAMSTPVSTQPTPVERGRRWYPLQPDVNESAAESPTDTSEGETTNHAELFSELDYDPRLPSRFSVTTTSTSTYVQIDKDDISFDDSVRFYPAPFDDVRIFEEESKSPVGKPKRRNPWRPML